MSFEDDKENEVEAVPVIDWKAAVEEVLTQKDIQAGEVQEDREKLEAEAKKKRQEKLEEAKKYLDQVMAKIFQMFGDERKATETAQLERGNPYHGIPASGLASPEAMARLRRYVVISAARIYVETSRVLREILERSDLDEEDLANKIKAANVNLANAQNYLDGYAEESARQARMAEIQKETSTWRGTYDDAVERSKRDKGGTEID